jgi:esterase/lipase superfamily enzyme
MHADGKIDWEEARRISLLKNRNEKYPLKVTNVSELGVLKESISAFTDPTLVPENLNKPGPEFAKLINDKLAISEKKDVFIYVHGYKVIFENPLLVATELWHFTGYDGVFIAYSWPSTPKALAYVSDIETASMSAHYLRIFIEYLSQNTNAARIHILGYSAGTRVVIEALAQLSLIYSDPDNPSVRPTTRVGQVILVGSDYDRGLFAAALEDGLLSTVDTLTVYLSDTDEALGFSSWLFNRNRLGELFDDDMPQHIRELLNSRDDFFLVDVTPAENAHAGNGHSYFRQSPWVSSDVLMTLYNGLPPAERGLVKKGDLPTYTFPENYVVRLRALLAERYPELATELPVSDY